ncbi:MAG TPA: cell division protein FtsQ/DivIB [Thermoleophilaceae bacterium]|nr:cell division protein FtsQ/DivIB [Thermoleophilaceae bacterium]
MSGAAAAARRLRGFAPRRLLLAPERLLGAIPPHVRRRLVVVLAVSGLLFGLYMVWLRDIGLVAVEKVQVIGLTGKDATQATRALQEAARESTTLHVDRAAIDAVAERFPVIHSVRIETDFPEGMRIAVTEQRPAAMLVAGSRRIPVAGDGSVLTALTIRESLPTIEVGAGTVPDKRLTPSSTLDAVRVAGGAPAALTPRLEKVTKEGAKGWVVQIENGPELIFGAATGVAAKWTAVTRVLADRDAAGADYIDLRIPGRPAAGGLPVQTVAPVAPAGADDEAVPPTAGETQTPTPAPVTPEPAAPAPTPTPAAPQTGMQGVEP